MQPIFDHIASVVRPALRNYLAAEKTLTIAVKSNDTSALDASRQDVMLAARQAVDVLHHLSDLVLKEPSPTLAFADIGAVRSAVQAKCVFLRAASPVADVALLRDVADAFKHHRPDRSSTTVLVTTKDGNKRALSSVLQNVFDAWMILLGQPLLPIGEY
jgi:hypothetical protein